jgi:hypothetical protein
VTPVHGVHFTAFTTEYEAVTARARQTVAGLPPLLRGLAEPLLPQLDEGTFSRIVVLLPYWTADLLDEQEARDGTRSTVPANQVETLALANLFGWWSYAIQDWLLDRAPDRADLLPLAMAFHAMAVRLLEGLLPGDEAFWEAFEALSLACAEADCWEQRRHFQVLADVDDTVLDFDLDRLADRSALLRLATGACFSLRGYNQDNPLCVAVQEMLRHYAIGRQIGDDRTDWAEDLKEGCLNYVSARIMRRMKETGAIRSYAELDIERMAGHWLYDDDLFADVQHVALAACRRAAASIAPYDPTYLGILVDELRERTESSYRAAVAGRRRLRDLFSPLQEFL